MDQAPTNLGAHTEAGPASVVTDYYRCPSDSIHIKVSAGRPATLTSFTFKSVPCFGRVAGVNDAARPGAGADTSYEIGSDRSMVLPFDPAEVVENFRHERYTAKRNSDRMLRAAYYTMRPLLGARVRQMIQRQLVRRRLAGGFPHWPLDCSVERLLETLMFAALDAREGDEIPFIWFWPEGFTSAVMMTHDVEAAVGRDHCAMVMDLDAMFAIKAAFQIIPEGRYGNVDALIDAIKARGFEANIHDLDHDGRLYADQEKFRSRATKINQYGKHYGLRGFRAGAMYRQQEWFSFLDFDYEMSVPTVAHLEPQEGGCCSVMPYFVGNLLELPLTTVQDHALFYILREPSIDLWKRQIESIVEHYGLISFIVHPDYIVGQQEQNAYRELLAHLAAIRESLNLWVALPAEINDWWRQRREMRIVRESDSWQI
ncbi:MAG TPA: hypothetical protein VE998_02060, partial [Terriglobales bacterium]|nr:hypothetical protein [Terriglobales bacterium]